MIWFKCKLCQNKLVWLFFLFFFFCQNCSVTVCAVFRCDVNLMRNERKFYNISSNVSSRWIEQVSEVTESEIFIRWEISAILIYTSFIFIDWAYVCIFSVGQYSISGLWWGRIYLLLQFPQLCASLWGNAYNSLKLIS